MRWLRQPIDPRQAVPLPQGDGVRHHRQAPRRRCSMPIPTQFEPDPELAAKPVAPVGFDNAARAEARAARQEADGRAEHRRRRSMPPTCTQMIRAIPFDRRRLRDHPRRRGAARAGSTRSTPRAWSPSTPKPPGSTTRPPISSASRSRTAPGQWRLPAARPYRSAQTACSAAAAPKARWTCARRSTCCSPMLADRSILKIFHNVKYDLGILMRYDIDGRLDRRHPAAELCRSTAPQFNTMAELSDALARASPASPIKDLIGSGKTQKTFAQVPIADAAQIRRRGCRPHHPPVEGAEAAPRRPRT